MTILFILDKPLAQWWISYLNISVEKYHGGTLEGNECSKLLKNTEILRSRIREKIRTGRITRAGSSFDNYSAMLTVLDTADSFKAVVDACFRWKLSPDYDVKSCTFREQYFALLLKDGPPSVTSKLRIVFGHVIDWCSRHERGLGLASEQAMESLHSKFTVSDKHVIKDPSHPNWATKKLQSLLEWNSMACVP